MAPQAYQVLDINLPRNRDLKYKLHYREGVSHVTLTVGSPLLEQPSECVGSYSLSGEVVTVASNVIAVQCVSYASF